MMIILILMIIIIGIVVIIIIVIIMMMIVKSREVISPSSQGPALSTDASLEENITTLQHQVIII